MLARFCRFEFRDLPLPTTARFSEAQAAVVPRQLLPLSSSLSVSNKRMTSPAEILTSQTAQDVNIARNCLHATENAAFSNNRKSLLLIERQESRVLELLYASKRPGPGC